MMSDEKAKRPPQVPSSGTGASSALDAMIRKRPPSPGTHAPSPGPGKNNAEAGSHKRRS